MDIGWLVFFIYNMETTIFVGGFYPPSDTMHNYAEVKLEDKQLEKTNNPANFQNKRRKIGMVYKEKGDEIDIVE